MAELLSKPCTLFAGTRMMASGPLVDVALAARALEGASTEPAIIFEDATGQVIDVDLRGSSAEIVSRLVAREQEAASGSKAAVPAQGRGRPKLGVVSREVTLLPRHWEWLSAQPGGASQALRRLVDEARQADRGESRRRAAQEASYRFMSAVAGDFPGYEEALRALFAGHEGQFMDLTSRWPEDVRAYAHRLAFGQPDPS
ncbi:DUF2239 family protein [Microvirga lotononidis]|uniref:DUF2239 domain-containing protein n=1 Tax=Microvirga lotononidis TaxID=864069 RepID=I4YUT0_9HYPH|nr:DUF2239 family protein [Microvirga lotononidis]EIM27722.1 hypothetical protein MicloDRAFT_00042950 [Microvirga lotononidis]WQO28140.1 DUF2239 family protein [Microvirga lotononidis]